MSKEFIDARSLARPPLDSEHLQITIGGIYQHYKGDRYKVLAVSRHSEDLSWYVVYQALYDNPVSAIWHRPIEMFVGLVDLNGVATPRFRHVT